MDGTYRNEMFADAGGGIATVARVKKGPGNEGRYFSLWLAMPTQTDKKSVGFKLDLEAIGRRYTYHGRLVRWTAGKYSIEAETAEFPLAQQGRIALVCKEGTFAAGPLPR